MDSLVIPSAADVRTLLAGFPVPVLRDLARRTGVPFGTIYKIASGETSNPGIETVRRCYGVAAELKASAQPSPQQEARDAA